MTSCPLSLSVGAALGLTVATLATLTPPTTDADFPAYAALLTARTYLCSALIGLSVGVCAVVREVRQTA